MGEIDGVSYLEHKRRTGLGQVPGCYCSYKLPSLLSVIVNITKMTIFAVWGIPTAPL